MSADPVFDNPFALKYPVISLSDVALELMIDFGAVTCAADCLPEFHIIDQVEDVGTFENGVVFKKSCFESGITGMGVELSNDITLRVFLHDQ